MSARPLSAEFPRLMTTAEVATLLRVHRKTVSRYRRFANLPFLRVGGRIRFEEAQVSRWLQERKGA